MVKVNIGDEFYYVHNSHKYEVLKEDSSAYYFCHCDGNCSNIIAVSKKYGDMGVWKDTYTETQEARAKYHEKQAALFRNRVENKSA